MTARKQTGVKITTPPTVTEYANGMPFDPTGMVVVAVYSDGGEEPVTDYTVEPSGGLTVGTDKVTVRHNGFTAEQPVTVTGEEVISHIAISGVPTDAIAAGSPLPALSAGDITVTAHYFSGKTETLSASRLRPRHPHGQRKTRQRGDRDAESGRFGQSRNAVQRIFRD